MNIENLTTLHNFLMSVSPAQFDMATFATMEEDEDVPLHAHECKTAGCAVGWAPAAGLPIIETDTDWAQYSERVFGMKTSSPAWQWCFAGPWAWVDNTPAGAAKRIRHLINEGIPGNFWQQMTGKAPYIFEKELVA